MADFSTYEGRQAYRDANPGSIVDASGAYYPSSGQTVTGGTASSGGSGGSLAATTQTGGGLEALLRAMQGGDQRTFDEEVRKFNLTFGLDQKKFEDDVRRFNENYLIQQGGLTGTFQGQQTLAAQQQAANIAAQRAGMTGYLEPYLPGSYLKDPANGAVFSVGPTGVPTWISDPAAIPAGVAFQNAPGLTDMVRAGTAGQGQQTQAAQQQQYAQQMGMIAQAASLQANPFRQQQALGQMNRLLGGQGVAGFTAPNQVAGVGVAGGNAQGGMGYLSQMIDDIRDPSANTASMNQIMQGIPTPNKLNSTEFLRAAPSTQNMVLQGMQEKYGIDPKDAFQQIQATLPAFQAPATFGGYKR